MRISDWSSDVCSSDLAHHEREAPAPAAAGAGRHASTGPEYVLCAEDGESVAARPSPARPPPFLRGRAQTQQVRTEGNRRKHRSKARRRGKECFSTRQYRRSAYQLQKNIK